ncbi:nitroreductase family protein [Aquibacillus sediminis]|uniref:nitroreductase family protein n=1 Tax=Aquibacillus sediminis TaxID=2574734 RepID=UPI001108ED40|nr:nitroreductase [Aquibacillus sediminis]
MKKITTPVAKVIRERRSIKDGYLDKPVSQELIIELLNDAKWAPNHGVREPWRFIFVPTDKKEKFVEDIVQTYPENMHDNRREYLSKPAAFLIVVMKEESIPKKWEENFGAVSSLIQNFQLLAWEQELGVVWKTNPHIYDTNVHQLLDLESDEKIIGFLHLGYFEHQPESKPRTPIKEKFTVYS